MGMMSGRMKNRVTLEKATDARDAVGQVQRTWSEQFARWAQITPLRGLERIQGMQLDAKVTHKVMMYRDSETQTIAPQGWRIKYGKQADGSTDRILDINAVMNIREQGFDLELHCTEAV